MPVGYLLSVGLVAWCTAFALRPPRPRASSPSNLAYWFGFVVNELPFLALFWLLLATVQAFVEDALDTPGGWIGLAIAAVTSLGLAVVARRGLYARRAVADALADALGSDWSDGIQPAHRARSRGIDSLLRVVLLPIVTRRIDVRRVRNVRYGDAGRFNALDIYRHRSRPCGCPVLIYLHGGAFRSGRKERGAGPMLSRLASQGWVCISANYRLRPAGFPAPLVDAKRVIAWVRDHGLEYGADPSIIVVAGSSAGAHLAATAALTPNDPRFQPGFERADTTVTAAIALYGFFGRADGKTVTASPFAYLGADAPPFFIAHGDQDTIVLVEDARRFVAALRAESTSPVVYAELPGGQHTFDLWHSLRFDAVVDGIEEFTAWARSACTTVRREA